MNLKKVLWFAFLAFIVFFVVQSPNDAADIMRSIGHGISHAYNKIAEFVRDI